MKKDGVAAGGSIRMESMTKRVFGPCRGCKSLVTLTLFGLYLSLTGCESALLMPLIQLDSPDSYIYTGMKFLDQEKFNQAGKSFETALRLDRNNSPALTGRGLVRAYTSDFRGAWVDLQQARDLAKTGTEKLLNHTAMIRYYTQSRLDTGWLAESEAEFRKALTIDGENAAACYFMGLAYKQACSFHEAGSMFDRVVRLKSDYLAEALAELAFLRKVQQAMPGTDAGRRIALADSITRADAAVLLMRELRIGDLYEQKAKKSSRMNLRPAMPAETTADDMANHPWREDVEGILKIGVKGLENDPEGHFAPDSFLTSASFALILQDIMATVAGDETLVKRFDGFKSPFPDVTGTSPYFNAAMVATTRGLMSVSSKATGEFALHNKVSGIEALLSIRALKDKWNYQ